MTQFTIPLSPIVKKNSQQIVINKQTGRPFIIQNARYRQYEKDCKTYIPKIRTIADPVNIKCVFYMPTRRRVDLTNLLEGIDDILVKYKVIEDDNCRILVSHDGSVVKYSKDNPRTEITIEAREPAENWL